MQRPMRRIAIVSRRMIKRACVHGPLKHKLNYAMQTHKNTRRSGSSADQCSVTGQSVIKISILPMFQRCRCRCAAQSAISVYRVQHCNYALRILERVKNNFGHSSKEHAAGTSPFALGCCRDFDRSWRDGEGKTDYWVVAFWS